MIPITTHDTEKWASTIRQNNPDIRNTQNEIQTHEIEIRKENRAPEQRKRKQERGKENNNKKENTRQNS